MFRGLRFCCIFFSISGKETFVKRAATNAKEHDDVISINLRTCCHQMHERPPTTFDKHQLIPHPPPHFVLAFGSTTKIHEKSNTFPYRQVDRRLKPDEEELGGPDALSEKKKKNLDGVRAPAPWYRKRRN